MKKITERTDETKAPLEKMRLDTQGGSEKKIKELKATFS